MSKGLKLFLGISYVIILLVFLYLIFKYIDLSRLNEFLYYKELQISFEREIGSNLLINLAIFFIFCVIWVALLGFGSPLLIVSGILFGKWVGTFISLISITIGALILYSIASFFFSNLIKDLIGEKFIKYIILFKKNEFNYFLAFRLAGGLGIPFGIQNILPVIFNIKVFNYFFASLLGFVPTFFIWNSIGAGLNEYIKQSENFSFYSLLLNKDIYFPIILFLLLMLVSIFIKKKVFNVKN